MVRRAAVLVKVRPLSLPSARPIIHLGLRPLLTRIQVVLVDLMLLLLSITPLAGPLPSLMLLFTRKHSTVARLTLLMVLLGARLASV